LALVAAWTALAPVGCSSLSAWVPPVEYNTYAAWGLPGMVLFLLYNPVYDALALGLYRLGYEASFQGSEIYPDDSDNTTPPLSVRQKIFLVYPIMLVAALAVMTAWSRMVQCG